MPGDGSGAEVRLTWLKNQSRYASPAVVTNITQYLMESKSGGRRGQCHLGQAFSMGVEKLAHGFVGVIGYAILDGKNMLSE